MTTAAEGTTPANDINQQDYIEYTIGMDQAITELVDGLHNSDDPEEILQETLVAITDFYDGDWAGIMEADLTMKIWSTYWWYNKRTGGMSPNNFQDLEDGEYLGRWIDAMVKGTPMIIENVEQLKDSSPLEYQFFKRNNVASMIAVPFWKRPTGFLIVRNPKRYLKRTSVLKALAFVAISSINEKRLMDSTRLTPTPEIIKKDTDIVINLFDNLQIITNKGVLTEKDISSPKIIKMIVYLLIHSNRPASPYEIVRDLWPSEEPDRANINVKSLVYRFQQMFGLISDYRLIDFSGSGYRINPELNVITDLQAFEGYWDQAQITADLTAKSHLLKRAIELYKHGAIPAFAGEHWFMPTIAHYSLRFMGITNQLLSTMDMTKDYIGIYEYANIALKSVPGNVDAYYWLIHAMMRLGTTEMAKHELQAAKQVLDPEYYQDLLKRLNLSE